MDNKTATFRLAVLTDAPDMAEIHARSWEVAYKDIIPAEYIKEKNTTRPALWQCILSEENTTRYVVQTDGKTVGLLAFGSPDDDDLDDSVYDLQGLYLHPTVFRQGIGALATNFAFNAARALGKTAMVVWVFEDNTNSVIFYEKCGFVADGKTKTLSYGKPLQCIRMRCEL
ncbi:MAG: GNAT family N-acetyltransferase [Oscillospiraceae bacterium]|nr:GNAT family N-acetyltransferase [Oscillospiraceae bacterium]